jgi:hypothetical protein
MEGCIKEHPEYLLLGKAKFLKLACEEGIHKSVATIYFENRALNQIYSKKKAKDKLVITAPPYSFQIDIFELTKFKTTNNGIYRCPLCVDIISRRAFAYPLKSGKMTEVFFFVFSVYCFCCIVMWSAFALAKVFKQEPFMYSCMHDSYY